MRVLLIVFSFALYCFCSAQTRVDSTLNFQTDPAKQFSLYVPSSYVDGSDTKLMLGLHPFNTNRWNSISWCDTLIAFAEENQLLLLCPDGGADGKVDDPIDVAFTEFLLEEIQSSYSIDSNKIFAMGFSWGGRTTYSYGLAHSDLFDGYMPIGAAVTGTDQVATLLENADQEPFYLVHGNNDSPQTRFYPILDAINAHGAISNSILMDGVGHTIDFPNRNAILTDAFIWLDSVSTAQLPIDTTGINDTTDMMTDTTDMMNDTTGMTGLINQESKFSLYPNPVERGGLLRFDFDKQGATDLQLWDSEGRLVFEGIPTGEGIEISSQWSKGLYFISVMIDGIIHRQKILIK